jgi:DNA repair protein RadC
MELEKLYMQEFPGTRFRINLVCEEAAPEDGGGDLKPITNQEDAYRYLKAGLENRDRETFVSVLLDARLVPLGVNLVAVGQLDQATVHPREVFKAAVLASASSVLVAHNHPSGDPSPSMVDRDVTVGLAHAGKILGIRVWDHIIVGRDAYESLHTLCNSIWKKEKPKSPFSWSNGTG